jgi:Meckel syndrome type 1 protein
VADPLVPLERAAAGRYSADFLRALDRALALNPQNRPQSVAEFRSALGLDKTKSERADALDTKGGPAAVTQQGRARRRVALAASIVIGTVGVVVAAAFFVSGKLFMSGTEELPAPGEVAPAPPVTAPSPPATAPSRPVTLPNEQPPVPQPTLQQPPPQHAASPDDDRSSPLPKSPESRSEPAPRVASAPRKMESGKVNVASRPPKATSKPAVSKVEVDSLVADALRDGEKCLGAKQYDCAIAYANAVLRFDPGNAQGQKLKTEAVQAQQRALSGIKIE